MRTVLEPRLVDPTAFEPGLVVAVRDEKRALLFDLGPPIQALPPRTLLRVTHVFVTHTHMDHFAGFDHLLALGLGRVRRLVLWGGPGFCEQVGHQLAAYTWNVVHRYEVPMTIEAHAIAPDGSRRHVRFESVRGFARAEPFQVEDERSAGVEDGRPCADERRAPAGGADADARRGRAVPIGADGESAAPCDGTHVLLDEPLLRVRAAFVDHEMPVLAFAIDEHAQVRVAADRIAAMGLATGAWLRTLKAAVLAGAPDDTPIDLAWRDARGDHVERRTVGALKALILDTVPGRRIGYVTDLRYTPENVERLEALLAGCDLLHIEAVFSDADRAHAQRKNHLTATQAGLIARRLGARHVVPFHFSPRYRGEEARLRSELADAACCDEGPRSVRGDPLRPPLSAAR